LFEHKTSGFAWLFELLNPPLPTATPNHHHLQHPSNKAIMANRRKPRRRQAVVETLGFGGYGGIKARVMDTSKASKYLTQNAPRLVLRSQQQQVPAGNLDEIEQPMFEYNEHILPSLGNDSLDVCETYRSAASEREGVAKNGRDTELMSANILKDSAVEVCDCPRRDRVKVDDIPFQKRFLLTRTAN
jgi:hypothetical protein